MIKYINEATYKLSHYSYDLPAELIAQDPLAKRSASRLLTLNTDNSINDDVVANVVSYLRPGDLIVFNNSRVRAARMFGQRSGGGRSEVFFLNWLACDEWRVLLRPAKRSKIGDMIKLDAGAEVVVTAVEDDGCRRVIVKQYAGDFESYLQQWGKVPLPPYIKNELADAERYQTIYSQHVGSVAAPTAGLHFEHHMFDELRQAGIELAYVTLHVGLGTFKTVESQDIRQHQMHSEEYCVDEDTMQRLKIAWHAGRRIVAVGTTAARVLETLASSNFSKATGQTDIFIYPGYEFKIVSGLLTNFHLPQSSLLMLVAAFSGYERIKRAYNWAIEQKYRFFSFGDAMLIWREELYNC